MATDEPGQADGNDNEPDHDPGAGSGDEGSLGTPSGLPAEEPPGPEQEGNEAVSGGGMVQPLIEDEPKDVVDKS